MRIFHPGVQFVAIRKPNGDLPNAKAFTIIGGRWHATRIRAVVVVADWLAADGWSPPEPPIEASRREALKIAAYLDWSKAS